MLIIMDLQQSSDGSLPPSTIGLSNPNIYQHVQTRQHSWQLKVHIQTLETSTNDLLPSPMLFEALAIAFSWRSFCQNSFNKLVKSQTYRLACILMVEDAPPDLLETSTNDLLPSNALLGAHLCRDLSIRLQNNIDTYKQLPFNSCQSVMQFSYCYVAKLDNNQSQDLSQVYGGP